MKHSYFTLPILFLLSQAVVGQDAFTLQRCIDYAVEHSIDLKNAELDEQIADAKVKETRGIGLPQIDGYVGITHNEKLPRFFATYQTAQGFAGSDGSGNSLLDIPGLAPDDVVAMPNFFQLKSSGDASISVNQLIFNSSYLVGLQAANAYRKLSVKETHRTQEVLVENISKAFYACLINKDRIALFETNIARLDSTLRETQAMYKEGFVENIDADRVQVSLNNLKVEKDKFVKIQELSYQLLKFQMNYPLNEPLEIEGSIEEIKIDEGLLAEYGSQWDYSNRSDYAILESNRELQTLNIKNKYAESLPRLSAFAKLGYQTQSPNIGGIFKTETDLEETDLIGPDKWYSYVNFGVNLNIPIFSGLQRNYKIQQEKLTLQKIENGFTTIRSSIDLDIRKSATNYVNAVETAKVQEENMMLAERIAKVTALKYKEGVGSNLELTQAEADLREAQSNYYNALYEAAVAQIDLQKAYGVLIPAVTEE